MCAADCLGSSSKSRRIPVLGAFWRAGGRSPKNGSGGRNSVQHNMGLCCIDGQMGRGVGLSLRLMGGLPGQAARKFIAGL